MRPPKVTIIPLVLTAGIYLLSAVVPVRAQMCVLYERQKLIASDASEDDRLGSAVAISKDRAIIGAYRAEHAGMGSGAAYVFRRDDNDTLFNPTDDFWVEEGKLTASDAASGDMFGWSVSIAGNRAVVGARFHVFAGRSGAAYVFRRDDYDTPFDPRDDFWVEEARLTPSDAAAGDDFGSSVSISGDRAVVGAPSDDVSGAENCCSAHEGVGCDDPGCEASVCGVRPSCCDTAWDVSCANEAGYECNVCQLGAAYVFRRDDNGTPGNDRDDSWTEEAKLTAWDAASGDMFGFSVSISGDRALVGAWHDDSGAGTHSGSAYVFRRDDNGTPLDPSDDVWVDEAMLIALDAGVYDEFGVAVSISRDRAIVGSWLDDDVGNLSGSAYVFRRDNNGTFFDPSDDFWVEEAKLIASDGAAGDELGKSVSIDGDRAVVGAYEDDDACGDDPDPHCDSGAAYVFRRDDNGTPSDPSDDEWIETAKLTPSDLSAQDFFGRVAISGDRVIAGSLDDTAGEDAGAGFVFSVAQGCMDLVDFADFQTCMSGEGGGVFPGCEPFNTDGDADVDIEDYSQFLRTFTGP